MPWLKPDGTVIVNTSRWTQCPSSQAWPNTQGHSGKGAEQGVKMVALDALGMAERPVHPGGQCGFDRGHGQKLDLPKEVWIDTIRDRGAVKFIDMNLKAFEVGYNADI